MSPIDILQLLFPLVLKFLPIPSFLLLHSIYQHSLEDFFELLSNKSVTKVYKKSQVCEKPLTGNVTVLSEVESSSKIRKIQQLMQSDTFADLIQVEKELKRYNPQDLPADILDVWLSSSNSGEQCRALRVQGAWRNKYHR